MKTAFAAVVAAVLLAACDRPPQPRTVPSSGAGPTATTPAQPAAPQTGAPSASEKREGGNPVQGQVDPKASEQHKDFQQKGDSSGPTSAETKPKPGN